MNSEWHAWLNDGLRNGCNPAELSHIMLQRDFTPHEILTGIENSSLYHDYPAVKAANPQNRYATGTDCTDYQQLAHASITQHPDAQRLPDERIQLYVLDGFLSSAECDALIERINPILYPSIVTISNGDAQFRTSRTSDLIGNDPLFRYIEEKIADALGIALQYSEPMQAQRYDEGNEFKPHTDYFNPGSEEFERFAVSYGQRTWTFMIYLNETERGGGTRFVNLDTTFYPRQGQALIWNNLYPDGQVNPDSMHHGMPVETGEKIIITKWFRDKASRALWTA